MDAASQLLAVGAGCLAVGYFLGRQRSLKSAADDVSTTGGDGAVAPEKRRRKKEPLEVERLAEQYEDFKMVSVVN